MPHSIVEYSFAVPHLQMDNLLLKINQRIANSEGNFDIKQCKARAIFCNNFVVADGGNTQDFFHLNVKILEGRSVEIRKKLAEKLLVLVAYFIKEHQLSNNPISLSVNIDEMNKEIYQKIVLVGPEQSQVSGL